MSYRNTRKAFALRRAVAGRLLAACALLPVPPGPASAATCSAEENVVCTDVGAVRGVREGQTVGFKGIPYAKPPVAALRWRPPEPPAAWDGVRDGSRTGPMCPQIVGGKVVGDEDCLTLNIWAPARPAERRDRSHPGCGPGAASRTRARGGTRCPVRALSLRASAIPAGLSPIPSGPPPSGSDR